MTRVSNRVCFPAMKTLLLFLCISTVTLVSNTSPNYNTKCCHGCKRYYCKRANCGDKCKEGPNCRGCWKDCK